MSYYGSFNPGDNVTGAEIELNKLYLLVGVSIALVNFDYYLNRDAYLQIDTFNRPANVPVLSTIGAGLSGLGWTRIVLDLNRGNTFQLVPILIDKMKFSVVRKTIPPNPDVAYINLFFEEYE